MNRNELVKKTRAHAMSLLHETGYISSVEVLMRLGYLSKQDYEKWRRGQVDYLEHVCKCNLRKLSLINKSLCIVSQENKLKHSKTVYVSWGKGPKRKLRFSKSGLQAIEDEYSTHYVGSRDNRATKQTIDDC